MTWETLIGLFCLGWVIGIIGTKIMFAILDWIDKRVPELREEEEDG